MNIKRSKDGCTSVKILPNQKITYDPGSDSYVIETDLLDGQIHRSTIPSHILDELHNRAWEGGDVDLGGDPVNPFGEP